MSDEKDINHEAVNEFLNVIAQIANQGLDQIFGENKAGFSFHIFPVGKLVESKNITNIEQADLAIALRGVVEDLEDKMNLLEDKTLFYVNYEGQA